MNASKQPEKQEAQDTINLPNTVGKEKSLNHSNSHLLQLKL